MELHHCGPEQEKKPAAVMSGKLSWDGLYPAGWVMVGILPVPKQDHNKLYEATIEEGR